MGCKNQDGGTRDESFSAQLSLFALENYSSNNSSQSIFDAREYDQLVPINKSEQGRIVWTRPVTSNKATGLYSEKLVVVQNRLTFDLLDARNGNLLRSIVCPFHTKFTPIIGPLCARFDEKHGESWFIDMKPVASIIHQPVLLVNKLRTAVKIDF
ncbi:hypothetical protein BDF19DRAFT_411684 [Syncephalis fuscata]|nr:hypothetical protein BDF19DRAFT_411684 [Syncephalis fuscata]